MPQKIVAGNWKMNKTLEEARELFLEIVDGSADMPENVRLIIAPPALYLHGFYRELPLNTNVFLGAQNCHYEKSGAFTGEIAPPMLHSVGVRYCIIGHSERRNLFGESDGTIAMKIDAVLQQGLTPILCCGESLEKRKEGTHFDTVKEQLQNALAHLSASKAQHLVIAYEPVWAIGTGETATPGQAGEMHAFIRKELEKMFDPSVAQHLPLLYGGSCKPENANDIFAQEHVDGGLIGGASLKAGDFLSIVEAAGN